MQIFLPPSFPRPTSSCGKGVGASCLTWIFSVAPVTALLCQSEDFLPQGLDMFEKHGWLSALSCRPLHSLVKSLNTTANTGSELGLSRSAQFAMFISLQGWDPSPATAPCERASNNMLSHMPFPMGVLDLLQRHGRAACPCPARHVSR